MAQTYSVLKEQFDNLEQQREASALGMWIFLITELLLFGGIFTSFLVYRTLYPAGFVLGSHQLDARLGVVMTVVLIGSSLTMALAVYGAQVGSRKMTALCLLLTILLGAAFLGIKFTEYYHKYTEHMVPGPYFNFPGPEARHVQLFLSFYFGMTGLHAVHMLVGIGLVFFIMVQALLGRFTPEYHTPVEIVGLYWHFVDVVWIFLFPLLYLIDLYAK